MCFDIRQFIGDFGNEGELISLIKDLNTEKEIEKTRVFRRQYVNYYGNAVKK